MRVRSGGIFVDSGKKPGQENNFLDFAIAQNLKFRCRAGGYAL